MIINDNFSTFHEIISFLFFVSVIKDFQAKVRKVKN